jgi:hypothetical protein
MEVWKMNVRKMAWALSIAASCWASSVVAEEAVAKRPIKMSWSEAESWLTGRGCTLKPDIQPDMPGWLIGWCQQEPKIEVTFMFARKGDTQPATCISLAFSPSGTPEWRPLVKVVTGGDVAKLPKPPGDNKSRTVVLKTLSGPVKLFIGDRGRDVDIGDKCEK